MVDGFPGTKNRVHRELSNEMGSQEGEPTITLNRCNLSVKEGTIHKHKEGVTRIEAKKSLLIYLRHKDSLMLSQALPV